MEQEQTGGGAVAGAGAGAWGGEEKKRGHGQAGSGGPGIGCFRRGRRALLSVWRRPSGVFLPARRAWRLAVRARLARARRPRFRSRDARGGPARAPVFKVVIIFLIFFTNLINFRLLHGTSFTTTIYETSSCSTLILLLKVQKGEMIVTVLHL